MEIENISVDEFLPVKKPIKLKNLKRLAVSESGDGMDVEEHNGTQGRPKRTRPKAKRSKKSTEPNESKVNMRKVAVPAHRYVTLKFNLLFYISLKYYNSLVFYVLIGLEIYFLRYTPLKENWLKIFTPIVEHLLLQVRFNTKTRNVEIRVGPETKDIANLQKAADFVKVPKSFH